MSPLPTLRLRRGPDVQIAQGHPWVFRRAIAALDGQPACGAVVDVLAHDGAWLARGLVNPASELIARVFTRNPEEAVDAALIQRRLDEAVGLRERLFGRDVAEGRTNAYRLVYSEADMLSGLVVDRYGDVLSVQVRAGIWGPLLGGVLQHLRARTGISRVHVGFNADHAVREGLDAAALSALSDPHEAPVAVRESGFEYQVDVGEGHKTGFYVDQRENRRRVGAYAAGRRVLSAYCYTGAFELHAARAGAADILGVDCSQPALDQAARHHTLNGLTAPVRYERGDVPQVLRRCRDSRQTFDLIVLDPPRFVVSRVQKDKGLRAYKDINLMAMKLLERGGVLATFSCSGLVEAADFREAITWAARDSGREVCILETLGQPPDHPVLASFPESEYLKGLICLVR